MIRCATLVSVPSFSNNTHNLLRGNDCTETPGELRSLLKVILDLAGEFMPAHLAEGLIFPNNVRLLFKCRDNGEFLLSSTIVD